MENRIVVMNIGTQGCNKFRYEGRRVLERKHFPPNVPVECSREIGEALLRKHNDPTKAIFFRDPNNKKHRVEIQNRNKIFLPQDIGEVQGVPEPEPEVDETYMRPKRAKKAVRRRKK